jgi:ornithine cyclodeaminase
VRIVSKEEISEVLTFTNLIPALRKGFVDHSLGLAKSAPITNIDFSSANGEMHIKPGYLSSDCNVCVKLVTCFYDNPAKGMPTRDGTIVVADRQTGRFKAILCDRGLITDMRTAGASAVAVDVLATDPVIDLGIVGTGTQAFWHAAAISKVRSIRSVRIWGRNNRKANEVADRIGKELRIFAEIASLQDVVRSDVVVSATPAHSPVLTSESPKPGGVIVAMGADAVGKREISAEFASKISIVIADSVEQCKVYGELQWPEMAVHEASGLGDMLARRQEFSRRKNDVVLFDSTGLGFQDAVGAQLIMSSLGI